MHRKKAPLKKIASLIVGCFFLTIVQAQIQWPVVTQTHKPWTRWWWEGSAVNEQELTWSLEQYQQAGLGGVEMTPIYGVRGEEKQFVDFLSPRWMQLFAHTLKESKRLGLGVDLANATGWPFGGPWVQDKDASKSLYYKIVQLTGGAVLTESVLYEQEGFVRTANGKTIDVQTVRNPLNQNKNLQELALDQIQFRGQLPLIALMAYNKQTILEITSKVTADGRLQWRPPAGSGNWTLYALFEGLHGKLVERGAPGGEGYAIDHFSKQAAQHYFKRFDEAFQGKDYQYLRAFFNDSYEVDDARGQANWTPAFFADFQQLKGYDLRKELPALFGKDTPDKNRRVLYDYRSVIDELLLTRFTGEWKKWANGQNKLLRNQSHGSPANTLDLYSLVDIPETEGNEVLRFKFASSAAHVSGKPLVSAEAATWLNEHFLSSWGDVKKAVDLFFLGGVNHIFYHGTAYSPKEAVWPGWLFYAAVHFQPVNPQWRHFHALNNYVTKVQSFLQNAKPDNDILVYYPIIDRYAEPGNALLQHFDGMEKNFEHTDFEQLSRQLVAEGFGFDFFSDRQLKQFTTRQGHINTGGNTYKTIVLPANKLITTESFSKILELVHAGGNLVIYKALPQDVPGLHQLEQRRAKLKALLAALKFSNTGGVQQAVWGKGRVYLGSTINPLLQAVGARKEKAVTEGVFLLRNKTPDGHSYFINNRTDHRVEEWVPLSDGANGVMLFDPMSQQKGVGRFRKTWQGGTEVWIQLEPYASLIIQTSNRQLTSDAYPYQQKTGVPITLNKKWKIEFLEGGPKLPPATVADLGSWTNLPGQAVKDFSGIASYTITFKDPGVAQQYLLNLGTVHETAEVLLNGKLVSTLIGPSFSTTIEADRLQPQNTLQVIVANLMANRIAFMDRNRLVWKRFYNINMPARKKENIKEGLFDASHWKPLPSGLLGPVTLAALQ